MTAGVISTNPIAHVLPFIGHQGSTGERALSMEYATLTKSMTVIFELR